MGASSAYPMSQDTINVYLDACLGLHLAQIGVKFPGRVVAPQVASQATLQGPSHARVSFPFAVPQSPINA